MTHEEACQRLELPEGTDIQEVRRKFAAMHSDYRMRIDNAPTPRLRQLFEQQLEQIKEAYSLLNGSEGMNDTVELPRTKRMMYEEAAAGNEHNTAKPENTSKPTLPEAYDYFGLSPEDDKATLNNLINTKLSGLKAGLQSQSLPTAKKLYEAELEKAESLKKLLVADWQEKEALAKRIAEKRAQEQLARERAERERAERERVVKEKVARERLAKEKTEKKQEKLSGDSTEEQTAGKSKGKFILIIGLVAVIVIGALAFLFLKPGQGSAPVVFEQSGLYGYKKGDNLLIPPRFEAAGAFKSGEARVSVNDSVFYIDESGKFLRLANHANKLSADENAATAKTKKDSLIETSPEQETLQKKNADVLNVNDKTTADAESKKSVEELLHLGNEYLDKRNYESAKIYYEKAIKKGSSKAMYKLGYLYANGLFPSDYKKAIYWYKMAVNKGEVEAMVLLGNLYANDYAGLRDNRGKREYKKAIYWYEKAINMGNHTAAKDGLASLYHFGNGVARDDKKAVILYEEAAQNGYASSMWVLGNIYSTYSRDGGHGVQKDDSVAKYWYKKGCSAGFDLACHELKNYK